MQTISIDINKVQKGDETEFRLLFNLFYPRLMSVACRFVPEHIAEDIVQSVFVMYWEQKSALIPNAIHSFLYKCTQNNCLNYLKHQAVVLGHEEEVRLAEERMAFQLAGSDANELWNEVVERDIRKLLKASISKLPPKCEGGNLAASKIRNLECPSYEICLIDYGCGKFNRKIHIMEQYP